MSRKKPIPKERFSYLRELTTEFQDSSSTDAKEQVLANLANFAYDPDNYSHFMQLNIVDLFLDQLGEENETLVEFAIGGLCNLALDKQFKDLIHKRGGIQQVIACLSSTREETVLSAVTTLMYLVSPESKYDIATSTVIDCMMRFRNSTNRRLSNLATIFLKDYCTLQQIDEATALAASYQHDLTQQIETPPSL